MIAKSIVDPAFRAVEKRRKTLGVSRFRLAQAAGVTHTTYWRLEHGHTKKVHRATLDRLDAALDTIPPPVPPPAIASLHRAAMILFAREHRLDPEAVMATDFTRQTSVDRVWLAAARVRRLAMTAIAELGIASNAAIARAIGVTKQNVGQAVAQIADIRDEDPALDAEISRVVRLLGGGQEARTAAGRTGTRQEARTAAGRTGTRQEARTAAGRTGTRQEARSAASDRGAPEARRGSGNRGREARKS